MKQIVLTSLCSVMFGLGGMALAQQRPDQSPPPSQQEGPQSSADAQSVTLTGCLTKATTAGEYVLNDKASGDKVQFEAPDKIEPYVNQTVKLTGKMTSQGGEKAFRAESVTRVATTCEDK